MNGADRRLCEPLLGAEEAARLLHIPRSTLYELVRSRNAINMTLTWLAQILEVAVEYGHIERNPAKGKRRRVKGTEPRRSWVEAQQLPALIDAGDTYMRPIIATLAGAGADR
jgi:hypothetical protein